MQNDAKQAALNGQSAVVAVVDKAQLPELVHEMTDSRAGGAHHLCCKQRLRGAVNARIGIEPAP